VTTPANYLLHVSALLQAFIKEYQQIKKSEKEVTPIELLLVAANTRSIYRSKMYVYGMR
jgi:hypothetical protein